MRKVGKKRSVENVRDRGGGVEELGYYSMLNILLHN